MNDPLRDLAQSTLDFYERFKVRPQLDEAIPIFQEEVDEFIEAARDGHDVTHIAEEAADVLVTVLGVCDSMNIPLEKVIEQIYAVIDKNNAKTHETHVYKDGKIRRRFPKQST